MKRVTVASTITTLLSVCFFILILSAEDCDECFSLPVMMAKLVICGLVVFTGSIYFTRLFLRLEKIMFRIDATPLLETNEAVAETPFSGAGEVDMDRDKLLTAPYSGLPCVYYHSITEKKVGSGKSRRWQVVENLVSIAVFWLRDSRGKLKIDPLNLDHDFSGFQIPVRNRMVPDPKNSEIDCTAVIKRAESSGQSEVFGHTLNFSGLFRKSEYILPPQAKVFVHGFVSKNSGELVLTEHPDHPLIISQKTKTAYLNDFYRGGNLVFLVHFLTAVGFTVMILSANYFLKLRTDMVISILFIGNWLLVVSIIFTIHNRLVTLYQRTQNALYNIDIELKRRSELVPKIVQLTKVYAQYERELFKLITQMRAHTQFVESLPDAKGNPANPLTVIAEKYPDLQANENFRHLQTVLTDTEERIAYSRAFYNRNVRKLNTLIEQYPFNIVSWLADIKKMDFITIDKWD